MRKTALSTAATAILTAVLASSLHAADITVSAETLKTAALPPMTALSTNATLGTDWTTCGITEESGYSTELAHLDEDGGLVLIDDAGYQHHAVWAASRPVTTQDNWVVKFRYEPNKNYKSGITPAGGWTFVMQPTGPLAYSGTKVGKCASAALGAPLDSYGLLFHHYFGGLRWYENNVTETQVKFDWQYFIGSYGGGTHGEGFDMVMTDPIDFTIACTANVWTVTMRQSGKQDVTLSHDFTACVARLGTGAKTHYLGFTGGSSYWNKGSWPMMYQKFTGISGAIDYASSQCRPAAYTLTNGNWACAGNAKFDAENGLLIEETAGVTRKYAAVGQNALYRDVPFELDYRWFVAAVRSNGAQGLSFSLVPDKTAKVCSNGTKNYYYPGMSGSAGFSLRSYNSDGLTWHADGQIEAYGTRKTTLAWANAYADVHVSYDGAKTLTVTYRNSNGTTFKMSKKFENLAEVFYPAFYASTADWGSGMTAYVQNYALRLPGNYTQERETLDLAGQQTIALASWNGAVGNPALRVQTLTLAAGAEVTVAPPEAEAHGGALAADEVKVGGAATMTAQGGCALQAGKIVFEALATLTLNGRIASGNPVLDLAIDPAQIKGTKAVKLLDLQAAQLEGLAAMRLIDGNGKEVSKDVARLVVREDGIYLRPKSGLTVIVQ